MISIANNRTLIGIPLFYERALEFLSIMDYILDIFLVHKRYKRQEEIDFNAIHNENNDLKDTLKYREILMYKLRQVESL